MCGQRRVVVGGNRRAPGFDFQCALGLLLTIREGVLAQQAQLLEAAADLPSLLRLVAADRVEALEVEGGERVGLLPLEAGLRRAELRGGVEQGGLDPLGPLALPQGDGEAAGEAGLDLARGAGLLGDGGDQGFEGVRHLVLEHEVMRGGEAMLERVARGALLALRRHRALGAGAVAAGGRDLGGGTGAGLGHGDRPGKVTGPP